MTAYISSLKQSSTTPKNSLPIKVVPDIVAEFGAVFGTAANSAT